MKNTIRITVFILLIILAYNTHAANCKTKNGVSITSQADWNNGANWNCGSAPGAGDDVTISVATTVDFDITVNSLTLANSSVSGTLTISSGTFTVTNNFSHGGNATSLTVDLGATLSIGGAYSLTGSSTTTTINGDMDMVGLTVGGSSTNSFNVGSTGVVTITSDVSVAGSAGFDIDAGGQVNITGDISVSGSGSLDVDGGMSVDGDMSVVGSGDVTIDGSVDVSGDVTISSSVPMTGSGTISVGGTLSGSLGSVILPVELIFFKGYFSISSIVLNWETASEINNSHFFVEKSLDGIKFNTIGRIEGFGNTISIQKYRYEDEDPFEGTQYYRLKQIDFDGAYEYSDVIAVINESKNPNILRVYPNPINSNKKLNLVFNPKSEKCMIYIYDLNGKLLFQKKYYNLSISQLQVFNLDLSEIKNISMAILTINNGGTLLKEKLVF